MKEALHTERTTCDLLIVNGRSTFKDDGIRGELIKTVLRIDKCLPAVVVYTYRA